MKIRNFSRSAELFLFIFVSGCGSNENGNLQVDTSSRLQPKAVTTTSNDKGMTEQQLGLSDAVSIDRDDWYMSKADGSPVFYRPVNYTAAMSGFAHVQFQNSRQKCSGMRVHELDAEGNYNVYLLTAAHCLFAVNPIGVMTSKVDQEHSFTITEYLPHLHKGFFYDSRFWDGKILRYDLKQLYSEPKTIDFSGLRPQQAGNSDVVRFLLEKSVSRETALSKSLPLCGPDVSPPKDLDVAQNESPIRMALGWSNLRTFASIKFISHVHALRLNGNYKTNLHFKKSLDSYGAPGVITDYVMKTQNFDAGTSLFTYSFSGGSGVEASDSGAPVLYGLQESPDKSTFATLNDTQITSWRQNTKNAPDERKVKEIRCVDGLITREFWQRNFDVSAPAGKLASSGIMRIRDLFSIGDSNTAVIQRISTNQVWVDR